MWLSLEFLTPASIDNSRYFCCPLNLFVAGVGRKQSASASQSRALRLRLLRRLEFGSGIVLSPIGIGLIEEVSIV